MFGYLERAVEWLRAGYPQGIPAGDYIPLVAVLKRRRGMLPATHVAVGSRYIKMTDEVPSIEELERVTTKLRESGWWIEDPHWRDDRD